MNGTSGTRSMPYSRDLRVLDAFDDEYGGVVVDPQKLPDNPVAFASILHASLSHWKKMVIFLRQCDTKRSNSSDFFSVFFFFFFLMKSFFFFWVLLVMRL
jgi:hypothetical protein